MEEIKITFLGTGDSIPTAKRNHTAIFVDIGRENILVDCGEGTQKQLKIAGISPTKIDKILITHWHGDHILGLPGLLQTLFMMNYSKTLKIYGPKGTNHYISLIRELIKRINIKLEVHEVSGIFIKDKDFHIEAESMSHGTPVNAYSIVFEERRRIDKKKLKKFKVPNTPLIKNLQQGKDIVINGMKIKASSVSYIEKGKKITFILDTGMNSNAVKIAKDSDILIAESAFSIKDKEKAREYLHLTSADAATIAKKAKVKKLFLTHISQRYERNLEMIEKEAKKIFKNVSLAKDFEKVVL
ncbi:MAG: ribonuclease Z [archaeon]|nr:ribonuclease Z [archaeon]